MAEKTSATAIHGKRKRFRRNRSGRRKRFTKGKRKFYLHFKMSDPNDPAKLIDFPEGVRVRLMNRGKPLRNAASLSLTDKNGKAALCASRYILSRRPDIHFRIDLDKRTFYDIKKKKIVESNTIKEHDQRNLMEIPMVIDTKDNGFHYDDKKLKLTEGMLKKFKWKKSEASTEADPYVLEVHFYWYYLKFKFFNVIMDAGKELQDVPRGMPIVSTVDDKDYFSRYLKGTDELNYTLNTDDKRVLHYLKLLGFYEGKIDGGTGKEAHDAIKKFQKQHGLTENGLADDTTKGMIEQIFYRRGTGIWKDNCYAIPVWKNKGGFNTVFFELATSDIKISNDKELSRYDLFLYTKDKTTKPKIIYRKKIEEDNKDSSNKGIPFEKLDYPLVRHYYDLPVKWSSRNYWTRYDNDMQKGERFATVLKEKLKLYPFDRDENKRGEKTKPLIFSFDDLVMVKANGAQDVKDKDGNDAAIGYKRDTAGKKDGSRMTLFHVKDKNLVIHDPEEADRTYFSKATPISANLTSNLISNVPPGARVVAFANDFYDVYNKRTAQKAEPFDKTKHVLGARAAMINDKDCHYGRKFVADPYPLYASGSIGNFELHYIHNGCPIEGPDGLKVRSFLLIYWNGRFASAAGANSVSAARVATFRKFGPKNAKKRWESKGYTIEPLKKVSDGGKCFIQLAPVFFFEGKTPGVGGREKCRVTVSRDSDTGWMNIHTSDMYWKDYDINNYMFKKNPALAKFQDIDAKKYEQLTIAHEFCHAMGKLDDYAYSLEAYPPQNPKDKQFSQWYYAMPYQYDIGSMMKDNRAPRMRHLFNFLNWVNDYSYMNPGLKTFLNDNQFQLVHRFGGKTLRYPLQNPLRDVCKPYKISRDQPLETGKVDFALYKLGPDETSHNLGINKTRPLPPKKGFDAILVAFLKIGITFIDGSEGSWTDAKNVKNKVWFRYELNKVLETLNGKYYLEGKGEHEFKKTYLGIFPDCLELGAADPSTHYDIEVTLNGSSSISSRSGKTVKVGNEVNKHWLANYILGDDDNAFISFFKWTLGFAKLNDDELEFARDWLRKYTGDNSYEIKDDLW